LACAVSPTSSFAGLYTNFIPFQSANWKNIPPRLHRLLEVLNNYVHGRRRQTVMIVLDSSAAFDTVNHASYLNGYSPSSSLQEHSGLGQVIHQGPQSSIMELGDGVLLWSLLGPLLFTVHCSPVLDWIEQCFTSPPSRACHQRPRCSLPPIH